MKKLESPLAVLFQLTPACNHNCIFCLNHWRNSKTNIKTLSLKKKKEIIDKIVDAHVFRIIFSGGEPTLDKDLPELISYAKEKKLSIIVETNGSLIDDNLLQIMKEHVHGVQISLEGLETNHNFITGSKNYTKIIENITRLLQHSINLSINITINRKNYAEISLLLIKLVELGVQTVSFTRLYFAGSASDVFDELTLSPEEYANFLKKTIDEFGEHIKIKLHGPLPPPYVREYDLKLPNNPLCVAGESELTIGPNGEYYLCPSFSKSMGSVEDISIVEFWNSKEMDAIRNREEIPEKCKGCKDFDECRTACLLFKDGDPLCPY